MSAIEYQPYASSVSIFYVPCQKASARPRAAQAPRVIILDAEQGLALLGRAPESDDQPEEATMTISQGMSIPALPAPRTQTRRDRIDALFHPRLFNVQLDLGS